MSEVLRDPAALWDEEEEEPGDTRVNEPVGENQSSEVQRSVGGCLALDAKVPSQYTLAVSRPRGPQGQQSSSGRPA